MNLLGHRIHTLLVVFPLGLLLTAVAFDILYLTTDETIWARVSYWMIAGGVVGGLLAAIFGLMDWSKIPSDTRAKATGARHAVVNTIAVGLFAASWLVRYMDEPQNPGMLPIVLGFVGAAFALVGSWFGREMVQRLGVGVHPGAHVNAPSSLTGDAEQESTGRRRRQGAGTLNRQQ